MKSGKEIGRGYLFTLDTYIDQGNALPISSKDSTLNLTELSRVTGIPKSTFYQNPSVKLRLERARLDQGIARWGGVAKQPETTLEDRAQSSLPTQHENRARQVLERRVHRIEQQNAALVAENAELRRQLKVLRLQHGREDMVIETGRRIPKPPNIHD